MTSPGRSGEGHTPGRQCTCRYGRDHDGSEFGPCPSCEEESDMEGVKRDASRWRLTRKAGFRVEPSHCVSDVDPNVCSVFLGEAWVGVGWDDESAIDCAIRLMGEFKGHVPWDAVRDACDELWAARRAAKATGKATP